MGAGEAGGGGETDREQKTEVHVVQVCVCVWIYLGLWHVSANTCICTRVCMPFCLWYPAGMCLYIIYFCVFCEHEYICALGVSMCLCLNLCVSENVLLRHVSWFLCMYLFLWVRFVPWVCMSTCMCLCPEFVCTCVHACVWLWSSPWCRVPHPM